jgi:hypothetical protein
VEPKKDRDLSCQAGKARPHKGIISAFLAGRLPREARPFSESYLLLGLGVGLILALAFSYAIYANKGLNTKLDILQEQINYLGIKDKAIELGMKRTIQRQEDLAKAAQQEEPITIEIAEPSSFAKTGPFDHIERSQIELQNDKFIIRSKNLRWSYFTDSDSMVPTIDTGADGIETVPADSSEIHIGDIISYKSGTETIIHRVVKIGMDDQGWYVIAKADNLPKEDPYKIRFSQIQGILVGLIY